jgi:cell division protein ZipA
MNELRWILLVAGLLLLGGLYLWGMRGRWRGQGSDDGSRRPAVFTGGAQGFETGETVPDDIEEPAVLRAERRVEPGFDDEVAAAADVTPVRRIDFDDEAALESPAIGRREPTYTSRSEPAAAPPRSEPVVEAAVTAPAPGAQPQKIMAIRVSAQSPARFDGADLLGALRAEGLGFGRYDIFHRLHDDGRPIFSVTSLREPGTFDLQEMPSTQYTGIAMFTVLPGPVSAVDAFDEMVFTARALATHLSGALADERGAPLTALRVNKLREEVLQYERGQGAG